MLSAAGYLTKITWERISIDSPPCAISTAILLFNPRWSYYRVLLSKSRSFCFIACDVTNRLMAAGIFKVIIVGGGPVGLTAAHALSLAGIDFLILERRDSIVLEEGASLVLGPNSLRVMHQFGLLDTLLAS